MKSINLTACIMHWEASAAASVPLIRLDSNFINLSRDLLLSGINRTIPCSTICLACSKKASKMLQSSLIEESSE